MLWGALDRGETSVGAPWHLLACGFFASLTPGCDRGGLSYTCACTFLTDFDDTSQVSARVCAPSPERAPAVARGCVSLAAPAPVQDCSCIATPEAAPCLKTGCLPAVR